MKFNDLHYDILYEIFCHHVSDTMDGPFLLTLVCTKWRDLVVSMPLLWSYITIDELSLDYQVKLDVSLTLSGDLPVTFALVLPLSTIKPFKDRLLRASSLHIHLDNIIDIEPRDQTLGDGDEAVEMMITLLKKADVWYEGPITWYYSRAPLFLSTKCMDNKVYLRQKQDPTEQMDEYFHSSYPIFHTLFSRGWMGKVFDTTNIFLHLQTMINLQAVYLSSYFITDSYRTTLVTITFPQLRKLFLDDSSRDGKVWKLLEELVKFISAPALEHVGITAPVYSALHMIRSIYKRNRPLTLTLKIRPQSLSYIQEPVCDGLDSLRRIEIEMSAHIITDDQVPSRLEEEILRHVSPNAMCTVIVNNGPEHPLNAFRELRCPLNVTYKGSYPPNPFHNSFKDLVDTLTFQTSETPLYKVRLPRCRKLCYAPDNDIHLPDSWPADLEELDSGNNSFRELFVQTIGSTFAYLTAITCTPQVASVLIDRGLPSVLRVITLVSTQDPNLDHSGFDAVANALQRRLSTDHTFGSNLAQLNVRHFPPWFKFLRLLHLIVQRRGEAMLFVGLPGLPHKSILNSLVSVLSGAPPVTDEVIYNQSVPEAYWGGVRAWPLDCNYCYNSGFKCYRLSKQETCKRFINSLKVSVTKDTIPV